MAGIKFQVEEAVGIYDLWSRVQDREKSHRERDALVGASWPGGLGSYVCTTYGSMTIYHTSLCILPCSPSFFTL